MLEIEIGIEYRSDYGKGPTDPESRPASSEKKCSAAGALPVDETKKTIARAKYEHALLRTRKNWSVDPT